MSVLGSLKPERVFRIFEEIAGIPHGSYNLEGIRDYLIEFAKARELEYITDEFGNVIMKKPATAGYENEPGVVLQAHMDMVAVCEEGSGIDMKTTPLDLFIDGDLIGARHTSLGADNGIGVAEALAILDSPDVSHPALEVIITANEETGMEGITGLDIANINGRRLINLDSEDEGILTIGCSGGARVKCILEGDKTGPESSDTAGQGASGSTDQSVAGTEDSVILEFRISGLLGGHSGQRIHLGRGNANKLMGRILGAGAAVCENAVLLDIKGGSADNAITPDCTAYVSVPAKDSGAFDSACAEEAQKIKTELSQADPGFTFTSSKAASPVTNIRMSVKRASDYINALPYGVIAMSKDIEGLVQTSLNPGILECSDNKMTAIFCVRSSIDSERDELIERMTSITESFGASINVRGKYPGWQYAVDSPLRDKMVRVFEEMYGRTPKLEAIHAGLECGWFLDKAKDFDIVSIGCDLQEIHSPAERLSISSTARVYEYLFRILADKS